METLAFIPSPPAGEIHLGPVPLRGYALCIIAGVFVAVWLGNRRWVARGGQPGTVADIAVWAVPFGLVGGRLYHVVTDYQLYFSEGQDWVDAFRVWEGGLGIWGAIALGALGAWIGCRRRGIAMPAYADAVAPGIALAQAIGRWGNWFNQELYGRPTDLPWAVEIDPAHRPLETPGAETYHPTFLYESLWCVGVALLVIWAGRRLRLGHGRSFALYVAAYTAGRFWIEYLRVDEAHELFGLRLNNWTSAGVFLVAVGYLVVSARVRPGLEETVEPVPDQSGDAAADGDGKADTDTDTDTATGEADETDEADETKARPNPAEAKRTTDSADRADGPDDAEAEAGVGADETGGAGGGADGGPARTAESEDGESEDGAGTAAPGTGSAEATPDGADGDAESSEQAAEPSERTPGRPG